MAEDGAVFPSGSIEQRWDMSDAECWRCSNQIDKRVLIHEVVEEFPIFDQVGLGNVERSGLGLLSFQRNTGEGKCGERRPAGES